MTNYQDQYFEGERPLFASNNAQLDGVTFGVGESPLKESQNLTIQNSIFKWKYPLWYDQHVQVTDTIFETMARSGIWYTTDISLTNCSL